MICLIEPTKEYIQSYYEACLVTWGKLHNNYLISDPQKFDSWKNTIISDLQKQAQGIGLPEGYVPNQTFWLVDTTTHTYLGTVNIRLEMNEVLADYGGQVGYCIRTDMQGQGYGKLIVKLAVQKSHDLGFNPVLITCIIDNVASYNILNQMNYISKETTITNADGKICQVAKFLI